MEESPPVPLVMEGAASAAEPAVPVYHGAPEQSSTARRDAFLIGTGWLGTGLALSVAELPFNYLLKDQLHLTPDALAGFMLVAGIPTYIKPLVGILTDAIPIFGTRRRHYLLISLLCAGLFWLALPMVPRVFALLLWTYVGLNIFLTLTSTVLGGLMVEVGKRDHTTGALSAQRVGITRIVGLVAGPLGGLLTKMPFLFTGAISGVLQFMLLPLYAFFLKEKPIAVADTSKLVELKKQFYALTHSRTLWAAAGLVILVIASPGFGTSLFYYQTNTLKFDSEFIGILKAVGSVCALAGAALYGLVCRRFNLRTLLAWSILVHVAGVLCFHFYHSVPSAILITGIEAITGVLAILPLYDLAARATPRGSEALGYSLMMSVWNFTSQLSNVTGAWLFKQFHNEFGPLVWINASTTALVLIAVPFLPAVLMNRKDGDPDH